MAVEIERKYLVIEAKLPPLHNGALMLQSYIPTANDSTVRVRLSGAQAFLTLKGPTRGFSRAEFEYPIPAADAHEMLSTLCGPRAIEKTRYKLLHAGMLWEVDVFAGANQGLILAEIELTSETQTFDIPDWVGAEVSADRRYSNQALLQSPWTSWQPQ